MMDMDTDTYRFIARAFLEYYNYITTKKRYTEVRDLDKRELAFTYFMSHGMVRHLKINNFSKIIDYMKRDVINNLYMSAAIYRYPDADSMGSKYRLGTDFVIDIDVDHIDTPCKKEHDWWQCTKCGVKGKGMPPAKCPKCGGESFKTFKWICDKCLNVAKNEILTLFDSFFNKFAIDNRDIEIHFSGQRGYHVLVMSDEFRGLDQLGRSELVDYLLRTDTETSLKLLVRDLENNIDNMKYIRNKYRLRKDSVLKIIENKDDILQIVRKRPKRFAYLVNKILDFTEILINIHLDIPVSIDVHRLIRMKHSLHGKTGMVVYNIGVSKYELNKFDPFSDAIPSVFIAKPDVPIRILQDIPKIRILDRVYGPYSANMKDKVSYPAAVFLIAKGVAKIEKKGIIS